MTHSSFVDAVRQLAVGHESCVTEDDGTLHLDREEVCNRCHIEPIDDETGFVCLSFRTTSWQWNGEHTDLHDTISVLLAACLRTRPLAFSATLWDVTTHALRGNSIVQERD
jgi:hypothetical protein